MLKVIYMKKLFLIILILLVPSVSFAAENVLWSKDLWFWFTAIQTQSTTMVKYGTAVIKTFQNSHVVMNLITQEACPNAWLKNSQTSELQSYMNNCQAEKLLSSLSIGSTPDARYYLLKETSYEWYITYLIDIKTKKSYKNMWEIQGIPKIQYGKTGTYFLVNDNRWECHGRIYLLTKTNRLVEQINVCEKVWESDKNFPVVTIDSFELKNNGLIMVYYTVRSGDNTNKELLSIKVITK